MQTPFSILAKISLTLLKYDNGILNCKNDICFNENLNLFLLFPKCQKDSERNEILNLLLKIVHPIF